ncbi:uncharacterized protein LOC135089683 [Scylla paramamosain]|uniref:uncharacterized protein LOC135089683 n=1 Tax=Scylla paramamosain TaxID=85552 RepID=UPI003082CA00
MQLRRWWLVGAVAVVMAALLTTHAESSAVLVTGSGAWTILQGMKAALVAKLGGAPALAKLLGLGGLGVAAGAVAGATALGILGAVKLGLLHKCGCGGYGCGYDDDYGDYEDYGGYGGYGGYGDYGDYGGCGGKGKGGGCGGCGLHGGGKGGGGGKGKGFIGGGGGGGGGVKMN